MGYASRAPRNEKNTKVKPKTESYRSKVGEPARGFNAMETYSWNPDTKRMIHNGNYCLIRKQGLADNSQAPVRRRVT
jgi:hypothetical protein